MLYLGVENVAGVKRIIRLHEEWRLNTIKRLDTKSEEKWVIAVNIQMITNKGNCIKGGNMQSRMDLRILAEFKGFIDEKSDEFFLKINEILEDEKILMCVRCKQRKNCDIQICHVVNNGCRLFISEWEK